MFSETQPFLEVLYTGLIDFYHSPYMLAIKIFLGIYTLILFANIVMLLILRGLGGDIRLGLKGMNMPVTTINKMKKRWEKVVERMKSDNISQFKVAIIEADGIADEILAGIGYEGENMGERLMHLKPEQLDGLEDLRSAHKVRNRIVHDAAFEIDKKTAQEVIEVYENFLTYLEFL